MVILLGLVTLITVGVQKAYPNKITWLNDPRAHIKAKPKRPLFWRKHATLAYCQRSTNNIWHVLIFLTQNLTHYRKNYSKSDPTKEFQFGIMLFTKTFSFEIMLLIKTFTFKTMLFRRNFFFKFCFLKTIFFFKNVLSKKISFKNMLFEIVMFFKIWRVVKILIQSL